MPQHLNTPLFVDLSYYQDTQLADDEIAERESIRQAWSKHHARHERERIRKRDSFRWKGGMP